MAGIYYTASERAPLITDSPAHVAGTQYTFDIKLQGFVDSIDTPKSQHVSIGGNVETVLRRASRIVDIVLIWPHTLNADVEEFLFSIAGGERFTLDAFGSIAVIDNAVQYISVSPNFSIGRMSHGQTPWRSAALSLRPV